MGIHGLLKELGPAPRRSLARIASHHYLHHSRPFRLAIDISIWLFQIQSGKGGSNPALRTFYYRLLRLLTLNIHPLFVFDGPNKPRFKRNKKVGGPGVRVASVPEFLAKQLLKHFAFPWHVAPGEAEAECALLQREGVVDAVLSEDVDTLMFGSGLTLRNWSAESTSKTPTHVSIYRDVDTTERSRGIERDGMILVALMSGGDYLPEGIPGCGPKVACDAARAGFGKDLCAWDRRDTDGLRLWKERLTHQIRTNEAKYFSRKNPGFNMPEDFPNLEVLGYYTHPCVSTPEKVQRLNETLRWDQEIDFSALRSFAADAFDWRCITGANKFIKNLAPAMLVRELRLVAEREAQRESQPEAQEAAEKAFVKAIHGKRNHATVDQELELRVSFTPADLVPIDLSIEDEDDDFLPAGSVGEAEDTETDDGFAALPSSTADEDAASDAPLSPTKKRQLKPFDPTAPEKVWILKTFLQIGCPWLVEEYEASFSDPKEFLKARRKAKAVSAGETNIHAKPALREKKKKKKKKDKTGGMAANALLAYAPVSKITAEPASEAEKSREKETGITSRPPRSETSSQGNGQPSPAETLFDDDSLGKISGFRKPATQIAPSLLDAILGPADAAASVPPPSPPPAAIETIDLMGDDTPRPVARVARKAFFQRPVADASRAVTSQRKPRQAGDHTPTGRKRRSGDLFSSPARGRQRSIMSYYSPSPAKAGKYAKRVDMDASGIDLIGQSERVHMAAPGIDFIKRVDTAAREPDLIKRADTAASGPDFINLISSPPRPASPLTPGPPNLRTTFVRSPSPVQGTRWAEALDITPLPDTVTKRRRKRSPLKRHQTAPVFGADGMDDDLFLLDGESRDLQVLHVEPGSPSTRALGIAEGGFLLDDGDEEEEEEEEEEDLPPLNFLQRGSKPREPASTTPSALTHTHAAPDASSTAPHDPRTAHDGPPAPRPRVLATNPRTEPLHSCRPPGRDDLEGGEKKERKAILLRRSLEGAWKEVDVGVVGLGMLRGRGRGVWRKSGVEVVDLTGS